MRLIRKLFLAAVVAAAYCFNANRKPSSVGKVWPSPNLSIPSVRDFTAVSIVTVGIFFSGLAPTNAMTEMQAPESPTPVRVTTMKEKRAKNTQQSKGWELARQKRTAAVKALAQKGILKIDTDDSGNQFLSLPWIPDRKLAYKSLTLQQRLVNEVCAGALGEISKDVLLYSVDTRKTRKQAETKKNVETAPSSLPTVSSDSADISEDISHHGGTAVVLEDLVDNNNFFSEFTALYAGFPIVLLSSIPQGGMFFLVKKSAVELFTVYAPHIPSEVSATLPIILGCLAYWLFRTPSEVIKTQVQTGQVPNVKEAIEKAKTMYENGLAGLWRHYPVMLSLDIPFQLINFILYGAVTGAAATAGLPSNVLTRLLCGASCGMISAAVTCPLDVCKTRITARDKAAMESALNMGIETVPSSQPQNSIYFVDGMEETVTARESFGLGVASPSESSFSSKDGTVLEAIERKVEKNVEQLVDDRSMEHLTLEMINPVDRGPQVNDSSSEIVDLKARFNRNMLVELVTIYKEEGMESLFRGFKQRLLYTGMANGIRLAAYGTSRMDLMMRSLDDI